MSELVRLRATVAAIEPSLNFSGRLRHNRSKKTTQIGWLHHFNL
jgi:hypothetical protein